MDTAFVNSKTRYVPRAFLSGFGAFWLLVSVRHALSTAHSNGL